MSANPVSRPNFIVILADDLGYADLGCYGARETVSPNLDRMAAEGLRFTDGYANSSLCSPTRFALITGRYQYRLRGAAEEPLLGSARGSSVLGLPPEHPTLPSLLAAAGYRTALIGKWHLGFPPHFGPRLSGYQQYFGPMSGGVDYFSHRDYAGRPDLWEGEQPADGQGRYLTDLLTDRAVDFIETAGRDTPFLLSLHYTAPHWPWETRADRAESQRIGNQLAHVDGGSIATFRQMVREMDEGIGRVMAALKAQGLDEQTLVVFTSDNGGERFSDNWPFVGQKMDLLEGGIRVPMVARWPGRIRPATTDALAITMDWSATMLAAAGVAPHPDYPLDGVDLSPHFAAPDPDAALPAESGRALYWRMLHRHQRAMRQGRWKYLKMDEHEYLFDVVRDARERANLATRDPDRLAAMRAEWLRWDAAMLAIAPDARVHALYGDAQIPRSTH